MPFSSDWRTRSAICRSSASSRWSSVTTDDWVAAGSSEKPAVSAGRPFGKTCRCTCWTWRSSRSMRCSGVGGAWRWAMARRRHEREAALAARAVIRRDFTIFPHASFDASLCRQRGLRGDESYCAVGRWRRLAAGAGGAAARRLTCRARRGVRRLGAAARRAGAAGPSAGRRASRLTFVTLPAGPTCGATASPTVTVSASGLPALSIGAVAVGGTVIGLAGLKLALEQGLALVGNLDPRRPGCGQHHRSLRGNGVAGAAAAAARRCWRVRPARCAALRPLLERTAVEPAHQRDQQDHRDDRADHQRLGHGPRRIGRLEHIGRRSSRSAGRPFPRAAGCRSRCGRGRRPPA